MELQDIMTPDKILVYPGFKIGLRFHQFLLYKVAYGILTVLLTELKLLLEALLRIMFLVQILVLYIIIVMLLSGPTYEILIDFGMNHPMQDLILMK
ncbi:hypothetical protein C2G38_144205 [Gigaspora rosea]|uniref:Uncharacterized protein n=1 Tax=Gigaspora rosea TaxID=44941 RepID=A0A397VWI3_9GLOM|nr:hypothetical protein C2G38_144205 [Gigaspora rosea]